MPTRDAYAVAVLAVLTFFVAFNLQSGWVYAVDALLVGVLVAGFLSARHAIWGIHVARTLPAEAVEGEPVGVALTLGGTKPGRRFFVQVLDEVPGLQPGEVFVPILNPRQPIQATYRTIAVRRGIHRANAAIVRSGGLAGIFTAQRRVPASGTITVYPRHWKIARFPLAVWTPAAHGVGSTRRRGGLEFYGLRDYRSGDSLRHVHWRSSARRGALMVREFEQEIPGSVTLLIDTRPEVQAGVGAESTFEDLIRAAASAAWYVTSCGGVVRLLASTRTGLLDLGGGWRSTLHALADLRPEGRLTPSQLLGAAAAGQAPVIALTSDPDAIPSLAASGGTHVAVIVADTASYDHSAAGFSSITHQIGVPVCVIRRGDDIGARLEQSAG